MIDDTDEQDSSSHTTGYTTTGANGLDPVNTHQAANTALANIKANLRCWIWQDCRS